MTEPAHPDEIPPSLTLVGDPAAEVCEGDACLLPPHEESGR